MKTFSAAEATEIEAAIKANGMDHVTRDHEKINWDEANQRYLPSSFTYSILLLAKDGRTGNQVSRQIESLDQVALVAKDAKKEIAARSKKTKAVIAAEGRPS